MKLSNYLTPRSYCKKNGKITTRGKLTFSTASKKFFSETYCSTDWDTVDKSRLQDVMSRLYNNFYDFDENGIAIYSYSPKIILVDLYH